MTIAYLPPEVLKKTVFDLVAECRNNLKSGKIDMAQVESGVRAYCESISALPLEEGQVHKEDLHELMQLINLLGEDLAAERDNVMRELSKLERIRKASIAYQSSDGMSPKSEPSE